MKVSVVACSLLRVVRGRSFHLCGGEPAAHPSWPKRRRSRTGWEPRSFMTSTSPRRFWAGMSVKHKPSGALLQRFPVWPSYPDPEDEWEFLSGETPSVSLRAGVRVLHWEQAPSGYNIIDLLVLITVIYFYNHTVIQMLIRLLFSKSWLFYFIKQHFAIKIHKDKSYVDSCPHSFCFCSFKSCKNCKFQIIATFCFIIMNFCCKILNFLNIATFSCKQQIFVIKLWLWNKITTLCH